GSDRHLEHDVLTVASGAVGAFAVASTLSFVFRVKAKMHQSVVALARLHDAVAAAAAITTRRAATRHELFPPEGHASVTTIAGLYSNECFINEHLSLIVQAVAEIRGEALGCATALFHSDGTSMQMPAERPCLDARQAADRTPWPGALAAIGFRQKRCQAQTEGQTFELS